MKRNKLKPTSDDPDFFVSDVYAQFRRLYAGVFNRALMDLLDKDVLVRASAIKWFRDKKPTKRETMIYFSDCVEVLDFKHSRIEKLRLFMQKSELGELEELRQLIEDNRNSTKH